MFARTFARRMAPLLMAAPITQQRYASQPMIDQASEQIEYEPKFSVHITDALLCALMGKEQRARPQVTSVGGLDFVPSAAHPSAQLVPGQSIVDSSIHAELNAPDTPYSSPSTTVVTTDDFEGAQQSESSHIHRTDALRSSLNAQVDESMIAEAIERGRAMGREEAYQALQPMIMQAEAARKQAFAERRAEERDSEVEGLNQLQKDIAVLASSSKSRPIKRPVCERETEAVLTCYRAASDPIQCHSVVTAYSECAREARNRTATQ